MLLCNDYQEHVLPGNLPKGNLTANNPGQIVRKRPCGFFVKEDILVPASRCLVSAGCGLPKAYSVFRTVPPSSLPGDDAADAARPDSQHNCVGNSRDKRHNGIRSVVRFHSMLLLAHCRTRR